MIDTALHALLVQHAGVGARVTPSTETVLVTQQLPRVVYTLIDLDRDYTDDGDTGLRSARYQLDVFADRMTEARAAADAITAGLDGYRGTTTGVTFHRIWFGAERFSRGETAEGSNSSVARHVVELFTQYRATS